MHFLKIHVDFYLFLVVFRTWFGLALLLFDVFDSFVNASEEFLEVFFI